ncbi:glycosyltransferase, partial [bacterium]|nr:glycosyltransferase [bacterium]
MTHTSKPVRIMDIRGTHKGGGGPDKTVLLSAVLHDKKRVSVLVTYLRDPKDKEFQITDRARNFGIPFVEVQDRRIVDVRCVYQLHRLLRKHHIDLFHAHDEKTLLYGFFLKLINPKLKIIDTCHLLLDYEAADFPSRLRYFDYVIRKKVSVFLTKRFLKPIMAVSGACKNQLINEGLCKDDIIILYNGI